MISSLNHQIQQSSGHLSCSLLIVIIYDDEERTGEIYYTAHNNYNPKCDLHIMLCVRCGYVSHLEMTAHTHFIKLQ